MIKTESYQQQNNSGLKYAQDGKSMNKDNKVNKVKENYLGSNFNILNGFEYKNPNYSYPYSKNPTPEFVLPPRQYNPVIKVKPGDTNLHANQPIIRYYINQDNNVELDTPSSHVYDGAPIDIDVDNPGYKLANDLFLGKVNPRTLIAPVIAPPSHDLSYWKANNLITHSSINSQKQIDDYSSGYLVSQKCVNNVEIKPKGFYLNPGQNVENYIPPKCSKGGHNYFQDLKDVNLYEASGGSVASSASINYTGMRANDVNNKMHTIMKNRSSSSTGSGSGDSIENYTYTTETPYDPEYDFPVDEEIPTSMPTDLPYLLPTSEPISQPDTNSNMYYTDTGNSDYTDNSNNTEDITSDGSESGFLNKNCGYNSKQLQEAGLPSNFPSGKCQRNPRYKTYNENVFTEIIQPGVFTRSEIDEPINSNIGISFQQQFPPTTVNFDNENGEIFYTKHDPESFDKTLLDQFMKPEPEGINTANVYDPRFNGYGTQYRSYTDDLLGQPKFFYDDINSVRMPNYITRSNIDFAKFADSYGPMVDAAGNENNSRIREFANDEFLNSSIEFRTGMMERLMRKTNAEAWQQRVKPITKQSQRGSMGNGM